MLGPGAPLGMLLTSAVGQMLSMADIQSIKQRKCLVTKGSMASSDDYGSNDRIYGLTTTSLQVVICMSEFCKVTQFFTFGKDVYICLMVTVVTMLFTLFSQLFPGALSWISK